MKGTLLILVVVVGVAAVIFGLVPELKSAYPTLYKIDYFPDGYDKIALNLLQGHGYRFYPETSETMVRTPLYPYVLASVFYFFGRNLLAAQALNLFFGVLTAYFIFQISKLCLRSAGQKPQAWRLLLPSVVFLIHPGVILTESRGGVESLLMLLITAFIYVLYKALKSWSYAAFAIAGFVFGLVLLTKSSPALFAIILIFYGYWLSQRQSIQLSRYCISIGTFFVVCSLLYSPWIIRNYWLTDQIVPTATIKGFVAHQGLYLNKHYFSGKQAYKLFRDDAEWQNEMLDKLGIKTYQRKYFKHFYAARDELEFDNYLFQDVVDHYKESPLFFAKAVGLNFVGFWFKGRTTTSTIMNTILTLPLLVLFAVGLMEAYFKKIDIVPIILFIVAFLIPHLLTLGLTRYHVPIIPLLLIVAMIPIQTGTRISPLLQRMIRIPSAFKNT